MNKRFTDKMDPIFIPIGIAIMFAIIVSLIAFDVYGINATVSGAEITVTGIEPIENTNGSALTDLDHINIHYIKGDDAEITSSDIPATASTGGGVISEVINIPLDPAGEDVDVIITLTATDDATPPNVSDRSIAVTINLDNERPGAPQ